jgi:fengycin family lipopeptide synthetase B
MLKVISCDVQPESSYSVEGGEDDYCVFPTSFAQQRLWFLDQIEPQSHQYNIPAAIRLAGQLNVSALDQALNMIIERHEVLRTTFALIDGQPMQVIADGLALPLPLIDLQNLPHVEREAEVARLATVEARWSFDLARGPLVRTTLLRLGAEEHVLLITMHHIVSDGWSEGIFVSELRVFYDSFVVGRSAALPELPIQYADFAVWQREWLQGEDGCGESPLQVQMAYWRRRLADAPTMLELPTDRPRPPAQTYCGASQPFTLTRELCEALGGLSRREGASLFMILLAAFQTLLYRYTGQEDIVVGSPIANRTRSEIEGLIGFFVNTLVLRSDLSGNCTFCELLRQVRETTLEAYAHQDVPFEKLIDALDLERNLSHSPLFQVMFALQNAPMGTLELTGLRLSQVPVDLGVAKFDLTLFMHETEHGLAGLFEYNIDLFDAAMIARLLGHFQTVLEGIAAGPEQRIADLPLLTEAERQQLLFEWNATQTAYPRNACIHELFARQAERTPYAVAAVYEDQQLTYHTLNQRANQLAHYLRSLGVGPEVCVGLYMERSLDLVVSILAILKAGGAYVPLDLAYPADRLAFMLADTRALVLLTQQQLIDSLPVHAATLVALDADWPAIAQQSAADPASGATASSLAYVMYTSGSTGRPKGVSVTHRSVVRLVQATNYVELTSDDIVLQFAPSAFDAATFEVWSSLLNAARLVIFPAHLPSLAELGQVLECERISTLWLTAGLFHQMVDEQLGSLRHVRQLLAGGDVLSRAHVCKAIQALDGRTLINGYGPTENTTFTCCYPMIEVGQVGSSVAIGRPIANTQVYILDGQMRPVPIGVQGDLYTGGDGLARGYLNRPELTAKMFVPNPFAGRVTGNRLQVTGNEEASAVPCPLSPIPSSRLYKTGDLARYRADGAIEFLGRNDHQVKIRGFRIELGEIAAAISQHPEVRECVVLAREDGPGGRRLVAYVVPNDKRQTLNDEAPTAPPLAFSVQRSALSRELRAFLKERLPDYMVPAAFVMLAGLPLTPNGKVDRSALPAPERGWTKVEQTFAPPRTPVEALLTKIWAQVLGIEQVGIHDNFFEAGGDSILSIQIVAKANAAGLRLTPKQLFEHQTIATLASVAGTTATISAEQGLVTGPAPLTPIQHWFFEQNLVAPNHWNQAVLIEIRQQLDRALLEQAAQLVIAHHDALRLRFTPGDSAWQPTYAGAEAVLPVIYIDIAELPEEELAWAIEATATELHASLNLAEGPIARIALFDLGPGRPGRLLIIVHHLAVDGVSWRILLEDLQKSYRQVSSSASLQLPAKTTSFKHWAELLAEYAQSAELAHELDYWLATVQAPSGRLPLDLPSGVEQNTETSVRDVIVALNAEETRALLQDVPAAYHTQINDVLLTALAQTLAGWSGERTLLIDLEGHGREEIFAGVDLSRTVGWFTSIFPVRLDLGAATELGETLKLVKEQLWRIPQRGVGYGVLRYLTKHPALLAALHMWPPAELSFNYLGQFDQGVGQESLFGLARESSGLAHSHQDRRHHILEVTGSVVGGRLEFLWTYSENLHYCATIMEQAQRFIEALRALIAHCLSPDAGGYTPSDFALAELDEDEFGRLAQLLDHIDQV